MFITYKGSRTRNGCVITANGEPISHRTDLVNHSPDGLEWGYEGSGPAQASLAILAHAIGQHRALNIYQEFKRHFVAELPPEWSVTSNEIEAMAKTLEIGMQP